jgi:Protein of unknown function (DUF3040)
MPLSDHERQVLAAMEAALEKEDPKLVSALNGLPKGGKGLTLGALLFLAGMAVLIGGLIAKSVLVGVLGFVIALVGLVVALSAKPRRGMDGASAGKKAKRSNWVERMNNRWDDRSQS